MARLINPTTGDMRNIAENDIVYVMRRDHTYKHTMHTVRRVESNGNAVTKCTIWIRQYAVQSTTDDAAVWCENGCKPLQPQEANS